MVEEYPRRGTLHELMLLREEYAQQLRVPGVEGDEKTRLFGLIRELNACIDRLQKELSRPS